MDVSQRWTSAENASGYRYDACVLSQDIGRKQHSTRPPSLRPGGLPTRCIATRRRHMASTDRPRTVYKEVQFASNHGTRGAEAVPTSAKDTAALAHGVGRWGWVTLPSRPKMRRIQSAQCPEVRIYIGPTASEVGAAACSRRFPVLLRAKLNAYLPNGLQQPALAQSSPRSPLTRRASR